MKNYYSKQTLKERISRLLPEKIFRKIVEKEYDRYVNYGEHMESALTNLSGYSLEWTIRMYRNIYEYHERAAGIAERNNMGLEKINPPVKKAIKLCFLVGDIKNAERINGNFLIKKRDFLECLEEAINCHYDFGGDKKIVNILEDYKNSQKLK